MSVFRQMVTKRMNKLTDENLRVSRLIDGAQCCCSYLSNFMLIELGWMIRGICAVLFVRLEVLFAPGARAREGASRAGDTRQRMPAMSVCPVMPTSPRMGQSADRMLEHVEKESSHTRAI